MNKFVANGRNIRVAVERKVLEEDFRTDSHSSFDVTWGTKYYLSDVLYFSEPFILENRDKMRLTNYLKCEYLGNTEESSCPELPVSGYSKERTNEIIEILNFLDIPNVIFCQYSDNEINISSYKTNSFIITWS